MQLARESASCAKVCGDRETALPEVVKVQSNERGISVVVYAKGLGNNCVVGVERAELNVFTITFVHTFILI